MILSILIGILLIIIIFSVVYLLILNYLKNH
nr:MAG TPA: hypothetical protein [Caudoviricetes sp.]